MMRRSLTAEKSPRKGGAAYLGALSDDRTIADGAACLVQGATENG